MTQCYKYPGYTECDIKFLPSYKRNRFDNEYFNKKNQAPSYTDRILMKNNTSQLVTVHEYACRDEVYGSDHRPVILDLTLGLRAPRHLDLGRLLEPL